MVRVRIIAGTSWTRIGAELEWVAAVVPRAPRVTVAVRAARIVAPAVCVARGDPSQPRLTIRLLLEMSLMSIRSASMSSVSPTVNAAPLVVTTVVFAADAVRSGDCSVSPVDTMVFAVTSIRSASTSRIDPTPTDAESDRVMLVAEGALPLAWLAIWLIFIHDHPSEAGWLPAAERASVVATLRTESAELERSENTPYLRALMRPQVFALAAVYFCFVSGQMGFLFWLPSATEHFKKLSSLHTSLIYTFPFITGAITLLITARHSDRTGERRKHVAAAMALGAIGVVRTKNVVHAALYLVVVLAGGAAQFILLGQEFVAWVQVLVYIGAVIVLFLFGIMLTRAPMHPEESLENDLRWPAAAASLFLAGILGGLLVHEFHGVEINLTSPVRTSEVTNAIFRTYLIPFEVVGVLLLGALVGAVVLARRD